MAVLPVGSLNHTVGLDNPTDAFQGGVCNMAGSLAACLHSVGYEMRRVHHVVALLDVDGVVEALTACLQTTGSGSLVLVQPPLRSLFHAHMSSGSSLTAPVGGIVSFLFLAGACSAFCSLGWAVMACRLLLTVLAGADHVDRNNRVCLACNSDAIGDEKHMIFEYTALAPLRQQACRPCHT